MMIVQVKCSNAKKGKSILYTIGENARIRFDGYTSKDESNFYSFGKKIREAATNDYYYEDIRDALKRIIEKNPQGKFVPNLRMMELPSENLNENLKKCLSLSDRILMISCDRKPLHHIHKLHSEGAQNVKNVNGVDRVL